MVTIKNCPAGLIQRVNCFLIVIWIIFNLPRFQKGFYIMIIWLRINMQSITMPIMYNMFTISLFILCWAVSWFPLLLNWSSWVLCPFSLNKKYAGIKDVNNVAISRPIIVAMFGENTSRKQIMPQRKNKVPSIFFIMPFLLDVTIYLLNKK